MLSSRWNQIKDPEARETCRLFEQAINNLGNVLGFDPLPSQQNNVSVLGTPLSAPAPPLTLSVTSVSGGVLIQITASPKNILPVQYFVETSASASFTNVTIYKISSTLSDTINVGTATLFYRCRCQSFNSAFSGYTLFGNPTAVTGSSAALGSTTGTGAVVLQTGPTISGPTLTGTSTIGAATFNNTSLSFPSPWAITKKSGSGSGTAYSTTSNSFADVDGTNLTFTVTIPTGWKLFVIFSAQANTSTDYLFVRLFDTQGSVVLQKITAGTSAANNYPITLIGEVNGDGNSHTIKPQFANNDNATSVNLSNGTTGDMPNMLFFVFPSN